MGKVSELHRAAHASFDRRDWEAMLAIAAPEITYEDHARGLTMKGPEQWLPWLKDWVTSFSDATPSDGVYHEDGDVSIAQFMARGVNDGQMGPYAATGRRFSTPFCEVLHWEDGKITRGEIYYDGMSILVQLGLMEPPPTA
jgi:steroid delta-isomerase-like uncharacterized protein